jgi:hypothetical protein
MRVQLVTGCVVEVLGFANNIGNIGYLKGLVVRAPELKIWCLDEGNGKERYVRVGDIDTDLYTIVLLNEQK